METLIAAITATILSLVPQWTSEAKIQRAQEYATIIVEESQAVVPAIDPYLIVAIIFKESSFRPEVTGKRGEVGLMQVMAHGAVTRLITNEIPEDPRSNIRVGIGHLRYWQEKCGIENEDEWISAYNAGRCKKTKYVKRVKRVYCKVNPAGCGGVS